MAIARAWHKLHYKDKDAAEWKDADLSKVTERKPFFNGVAVDPAGGLVASASSAVIKIDGVSSMTGVDSLTLQPGETVEMLPGGYHLMMMGPRQSMAPGNQVLVQMTTAAGQTFEYEVSVENR